MAQRYYASGFVRQPEPGTGEWQYMSLFHRLKQEHPWRFGGGKIENGELPMCAAIREVWEEVAVEAHSVRFITTTPPFAVDGDEWSGYFYLIEPSPNKSIWALREPDKISEVRWFTKAEMYAHDMHPEFEVVCELEAQEKAAIVSW